MPAIKYTCAIGLILAGLTFITNAQAQPAEERLNQFKAAYVFKMARFVDWGTDELEIKLCMAPGIELERYQSALNNRPLDDNRILTTSIEPLNSSCHVYFGPTDAAVAIPPNTLAIGDNQNTLENGGHIQLFLENGRLQFRVNNAELKVRARQGNFRISSKLMRLARRV